MAGIVTASALMAALLIALPGAAYSAPVTDIIGVPNMGWTNADVTFWFLTDWEGDPSVYTYFAMDPTGSDTPPSFAWPPDEDGWAGPPGPDWVVYHYDKILVSQEGTTSVWYWSYHFC